MRDATTSSRVRVFASFEAENRAEHGRLRAMTPEARWEEFARLQERAWGEKWTRAPMVKVAAWEETCWDG